MKRSIDSESVLRIVLPGAISLLGGCVFYAFWLAAYLFFSRQMDSEAMETAMWILAPVITGLGFTIARIILGRFKHEQLKFWEVYVWTFTGCAVGVLAVYWYGPMLIVFSMLGLGTLSVLLRELNLSRRTK